MCACSGMNQNPIFQTITAQPLVSSTHWNKDSNETQSLKELYQQSIDTDVEKGFVKILGKSEVKGTFGKEWYLPHHPVLNPNKPGKDRRVCNAAAKYKDICLNDNLLAGPDLLHGLIGTIFRFREGPIALTADIESSASASS